jgi:arylsulfatase A-like enzyme
VRGGRVVGRSDKQGGSPTDNPVHVSDLFATMYQALGVGPDTPVHDPTGRPLFVVQGKPVPDV